EEPGTRAASRSAAVVCRLRGRVEVRVVRPARSPDHSRGADLHAREMAADPARAARAVLPLRRVRGRDAHRLALPPQPPVVRAAGAGARGPHAAALRRRPRPHARPRRVSGDRRPAAAQLRRPRAHRRAGIPHATGPGEAGTDSGTGGARVDPRSRHARAHRRPAPQSPAARLDVRVDPHGGSRAARLFRRGGPARGRPAARAHADPALVRVGPAPGLTSARAAWARAAGLQTGRSFGWALLPAFIGLSVVRPGAAGFSTFYLATSALILIVAVVEASYHMAYQDSLTGLPARRALNEALLR